VLDLGRRSATTIIGGIAITGVSSPTWCSTSVAAAPPRSRRQITDLVLDLGRRSAAAGPGRGACLVAEPPSIDESPAFGEANRAAGCRSRSEEIGFHFHISRRRGKILGHFLMP
jgi:hypothetical protein